MPSYTINVKRDITDFEFEDKVINFPFSLESDIYKTSIRSFAYIKADENLSEQLLDLLEIATVIFYADKLCLRSNREQWVRTITINIELRNPKSFSKIYQNLKLCLSILGSDNITFNVKKLQKHKPKFQEKDKSIYQWRKFTEISLFSGGQDSTVGAAKLLHQRRNPLFIRVNTHDKANISGLIAKMNELYNQKINVYTQPIASINNTDVEVSQRLRSFYFLAIAYVFAYTYKVKKILINENGIMAIHLPLDNARTSSFSTKTAYPVYLNLIQKVFSNWTNFQIEILNPFLLKTKTDVLNIGKDIGALELMNKTTSCAHSASIQQTVKLIKHKPELISNSAPDHHCGYCFPCILRKISMYEAGIDKHDISYACDPFKASIDGDSGNYQFIYEATSAIFGLFRLANLFNNLKKNHPTAYPQIPEISFLLKIDSNEIIKLHKKFAKEVEHYVAKNVNYYNFIFDAKKSKELDVRINQLVSENSLSDIYSLAKVEDATDSFERQIINLASNYGMRIQVALANKNIDEKKIKLIV